MKKIHFKEIDSTNTYGKNLIRTGNFTHGTLITADMQTGGRGRFDRSFFSEGGLYMSLLLDARCMEYPITCAAAVSVVQTLFDESGIRLSVKWVNDLLYNNKKVCGILTEAVCNERGKLLGFVCGIGLNTEDTVLPKKLHSIATVLPVCKNELAQKIAEKLLCYYETNENIMPLYKKNLLLDINVDVYQNDEFLYSGYAFDINNAGNLLVSDGEERHVLSSGEISIKVKEFS